MLCTYILLENVIIDTNGLFAIPHSMWLLVLSVCMSHMLTGSYVACLTLIIANRDPPFFSHSVH